MNPFLAPDPSTHWEKPPNIAEDEVDCSWDIRPGCLYWLSLQGFNEDWRSQAEDFTYVKKIIACLYFTVEFKRDSETDGVAIK